MIKNVVLLTALTLFLISCQTKSPDNSGKVAGEEVVNFMLTEIWSTDTVLKTPESVLFNPSDNMLYVANINGNPTEKDGNGFISRLNPDGTVVDLEWVTGMDAPKGMGVYKNWLFVTDIDQLVIINMEEAIIQEKVPYEGAVFLNDITVSGDGTVYISDMRTGKIHTWKQGKAAEWKTGLEGVNGLFDEGEEIMVNAGGSGEVLRMNKATGETTVIATGIRGDGVEYSGIDNYYVVSEWSGRVHVVAEGFAQKLIDSESEGINTADIGYNMAEKIVYVPTFFDNRVVAYSLAKE